ESPFIIKLHSTKAIGSKDFSQAEALSAPLAVAAAGGGTVSLIACASLATISATVTTSSF
ncbi:hypothetical protein A2U01_0094697, partial [Trifolium medium]|nr:hypothetical protein [Trifolium medium]